MSKAPLPAETHEPAAAGRESTGSGSLPQPAEVPPLRLVALGDGVFAIVMTLLMFQLGVPAVTEGGDGLARRLLGMWPDFLMYALSFLVLGVFWLIHHLIFEVIERYDTTLMWLNIVFLMVAALIPFSTELFGEHGPETVTAVVYGLNMSLVFAMGWATFSYATRRGRLVAPGFDPAVARGATAMGALYMAVMAPSIAVSAISPVASFTLYGLLVLTIIVFTVLGRAEIVMVLPVRHRPGDNGDHRQPGPS